VPVTEEVLEPCNYYYYYLIFIIKV